jgi:hypothetical protein
LHNMPKQDKYTKWPVNVYTYQMDTKYTKWPLKYQKGHEKYHNVLFQGL